MKSITYIFWGWIERQRLSLFEIDPICNIFFKSVASLLSSVQWWVITSVQFVSRNTFAKNLSRGRGRTTFFEWRIKFYIKFGQLADSNSRLFRICRHLIFKFIPKNILWCGLRRGGAGSSLLTILVCSGWCLLHLSFSNLFKKKYVNDYEDWMGVVAVANSLLAILVCSALHSSIRSAACICLGCQYLESLWPRWRLIICMECIWLRMTEALSIFFQDYLITEEKA